MADNHRFWNKIWYEAEPIIAHAIIVLLLEISLLLIGLLLLGLQRLFPNQEGDFLWIKKIDIWVALALLSIFGIYTIIRVGIRLFRGIVEEYRGKESKGND